MARKTSTIVPVTVTAGGKVTLADLKVLRETHKVAIKGVRTLDNVQPQVEAAGFTLQVTFTDNANKVLAEGKELGLLRTQRSSTPKGKKGKGKKATAPKAAPKASRKGLVDFTKNDGTVVRCTPGQAAAWSKFRDNAVERATGTVAQAPKADAKAKASTPEVTLNEATIAAIAKVVAGVLAAQ